MPSLQQLRYLAALAETLHFRRAAELTNVTQPTLSAQLKEMEHRLGAQLVERSRSRVLLTPVGEEIAARAKRILREVEDIRVIARQASPLSGTIRVGVVQSLGSYLMPLIIPDLHESHPDLRLYMREALAETLIDNLENGTLDILFFPLPLDMQDIETVPLFSEPLRVVLSRDHRLAGHDAIPPDALAGETILTLEKGHRLYDQVRVLADTYHAKLSHDFEGTSLDTLRQMVAMGMGITFLPALYVRSEVTREPLVVHRPVAGHEPARLVGMAWRRSTARADEYRDLSEIIAGILAVRAPEVSMRDAGARVQSV